MRTHGHGLSYGKNIIILKFVKISFVGGHISCVVLHYKQKVLSTGTT